MLKDASTTVKLLMLVLTASMMVFAVWKLSRLYILRKNGDTAQGVIEGFAQKRSNPQSLTNDKMAYAPVFSFMDKKGKKITLTSANFTEEKKLGIGDEVTVYYPEGKPLKALLKGDLPWKLYFVLAFLGLTGSVFMVYYLMHKPN